MWKKPVSTISAENHHETTCFPIHPCFFIGVTKKNPHWTNDTPIESAWNYRRRVGRWRLKKRRRSGFSRGKRQRARKLASRATLLSLVRRERSLAWPKELN